MPLAPANTARPRLHFRDAVVEVYRVRRLDSADVRRGPELGEVDATSRDAAREEAALRWGGRPEDYGVRYWCTRHLATDLDGRPLRRPAEDGR